MLQRLRWLASALLLGAGTSWADAEQVRYRFVPTDACGTTTQTPVGPEGSMGELKMGLGWRPQPYPYVIRPNQMVTFRHPYTCRNVMVPVRMPPGTPRTELRSDRIIYTFGDYVVEARFLPDGSVDMLYNSGLARPLQFD